MSFLGDNRECKEVQELFVDTDEVGINGQTVPRDCSTCERAGQGPAGE